MDNVFAALFVAFFCVFASKDPGVRRKLSERILDEDVISLDVGEINKDTAERELDYWVKGSEDYGITSEELDSGIYQSSGYSDVEFSSRKLLSVSEHIPRRHLGHRRRKHRVLITASAPGPAQDSSPSPSPSHSPSSSPSPLPEPSDRAPPLTIPKPMQLPRNIIPPFPSNQRNNDTNDTNQQKYILAALVASLVLGVFLMALLLFVCLRKESRDDPKHEHKDEKPTLNLISSNINHSGSSAHTMSKSSGKDFKAPSTVPHQLSEPKPNEPQLLLPLPPGRTLAAAPLEPSSPPPPLPNPPAPAAPPPPPPKPISRPPNPPPPGPAKLSPLGPHHRRVSTGEASDGSNDSEAPKTKLKPFFWDKVLASPNHSMVWHEIKAGSFQFNEEMMESLFGYAPPADKNKNDSKKDSSYDSPPQFIQIIDPKKSQNLSILLKALNVTTEEVCQALQEGNELPPELTQTLLRMAPTSDEELRLRLYTGDISHLGPAERFLKAVVDIPFAFKRLESLLFVSTFAEDFSSTKDSLATLEVACTELRNSRLFLKLLEAVLKTGNRMNDGTYRGGAQAFKLDTLLKLSDVKGTDGKTTLLNFVVQEIIRSEGIRAARRLKESTSMSSVKTEDLFEESHREVEEYHRSLGLQVVSSLSNELQNVKKGAMIDTESLSETVHKLGVELEKTRAFLDGEMKDVEGENEFREALASFAERCESDIEWVKAEEKRIMSMVKSTGDYFHGRAGREESSQLFVIVRDFLLMLDKSCLEVKNASRLSVKTGRKEAASRVSASSASPVSGASESALEMHRQLFPAMRERQMDDDFDSSDDES